jgi:sugar phosphate isomerase/epimerase
VSNLRNSRNDIVGEVDRGLDLRGRRHGRHLQAVARLGGDQVVVHRGTGRRHRGTPTLDQWIGAAALAEDLAKELFGPIFLGSSLILS